MIPSSHAIGETACIVMEGADARRFAQAQFSGDVQALSPGRWQWNAWLTAQGRVRALMHLADPGDGRLLAILRGGDAGSIHDALARYLLRMRSTLTLTHFGGFAEEPMAEGAVRVAGHGGIVLGYGARSLRLDTAGAPADPAASLAWRLEDIRQGWPSLPATEDPGFLPPALGLEHLGAVAFAKGCYPGQEIAARLHYRGGHKLRLHHLRGDAALPRGAFQGEDGRMSWVLDAVRVQQTSEALIIAPEIKSSVFNILDNIYTVVSTFGA